MVAHPTHFKTAFLSSSHLENGTHHALTIHQEQKLFYHVMWGTEIEVRIPDGQCLNIPSPINRIHGRASAITKAERTHL